MKVSVVLLGLVIAAGAARAQGETILPGPATVASPAATTPRFVAKSDFPGGSIQVEEIDPASRTIRFLPSLQPGRGWTCWWYFKLEGLTPGSTVTLDLGGSGWGQPNQAFFSYDNRTWRQTAPGERANRRIVYRVPVGASEAWFAWGPPFGLRQLEELIASVCETSPAASAFELAKTREQRPVPALKIEEPAPAPTTRAAVWIQARQHAWEAGSSWVAAGLATWLVSDDPVAKALRTRATVYIVPVTDVDNVERGAGGKNQQPHDQNHDWGASPHFPEVAAAIEHITALESDGRLAAFFDLHNPGASARHAFFYIPAQPLLTPQRVASQERYFQIAREELSGPMAFIGELGPCGATYDPAVDKTSESWVAHHSRPALLSLTLETPWNTSTSTREGYAKIGEQLGRSIERYLRETPLRLADK